MAKNKKNKIYYVSRQELWDEIAKFKESGEISNELGAIFIKIATHFASRPSFSGYSYKEDFIGDAILRMVEQVDKIDLTHPKCNPFTYLTMLCYRVFIAKIQKEKKYQNVKTKIKDKFFDELEYDEGVSFKKNPDENDLYEN